MTDTSIVAEALSYIASRLSDEDSSTKVTVGKLERILREVADEIRELKVKDSQAGNYK